jgi:mono/diheme cytochrome c family protein
MSFLFMMMLTAVGLVSGQSLKEPALSKLPPEYQSKHMPAGGWSDPKMIKEGKEIFEGMVNAMVNCSVCHGMDGKPMLPGSRDFRDAGYMGKMTDSYWFWRIAEGVPDTQMMGFKKMLKEEQIWKVISYENTFAKTQK